MQVKCSSCGALNPSGKVFCIACNKPLITNIARPGIGSHQTPGPQPPNKPGHIGSSQVPPQQHRHQIPPVGQRAIIHPPGSRQPGSGYQTPSNPVNPPAPVPAQPPTQRNRITLEKLAGIATIIATIITVLYFAFPDFGKPPTPPQLTPGPNAMGATIEDNFIIKIYPDYTLEDYLKVTRGLTMSQFKTELKRVSDERGLSLVIGDEYYEPYGVEVKAQVQLTGFKGRDCYLEWTMYDAVTGNEVAGRVNQFALPEISYQGEAETDRWTWTFFVPAYNLNGEYYFIVAVLNDRFQELDHKSTYSFKLP